MKYLVDANVLSEPTKSAPQLKVVDWLRRNEREIAIDRVILGELRFGILLCQKVGGARLEEWFARGIERLVACHGRRAKGRAMPIKDSLIAATALLHGLTVATRNRADFAKAGLEIIDPFAG